MKLIISTRAELLKTKRSAAFWLSVFGALFMPAIFFLMYMARPDIFLPLIKPDPWRAHLMRGWESLSAFLLPMFIILITTLIPQIEYKNNTWKQVFASPQPIFHIYVSKLLAINLMVLFCFSLFVVFMISCALLINAINNDFPFFDSRIDLIQLLGMMLKSYLSILGITAIQYWLSLRFKNFIAPVGIGLALLIVSLTIFQWEHIYKVPYAHSLLSFQSIATQKEFKIENHEFNSIIYFIGFTVLAYLDLKYRREKG